MMGCAIWDTATPVAKGTNALLALSEELDMPASTSYACLHCGKCISVCPMHLMPLYIVKYAEIKDFKNAEKFNALSCVECGSCAYTCPGKLPLVQLIRLAKTTINNEKRALAAKEAAKAAEKEGK